MQNPCQLPEELLAKISEFSVGGFALFITQNHGVDSYMYCDNKVMRLGLQSHILKLVSSQESIEEQMVFANLMEGMEQEVKATKKRRKKGSGGDIGDNQPPA